MQQYHPRYTAERSSFQLKCLYGNTGTMSDSKAPVLLVAIPCTMYIRLAGFLRRRSPPSTRPSLRVQTGEFQRAVPEPFRFQHRNIGNGTSAASSRGTGGWVGAGPRHVATCTTNCSFPCFGTCCSKYCGTGGNIRWFYNIAT